MCVFVKTTLILNQLVFTRIHRTVHTLTTLTRIIIFVTVNVFLRTGRLPLISLLQCAVFGTSTSITQTMG